MKMTKLLIPILLFSMGSGFQSEAQVTITESNFPRLGNFIDTLYFTSQAGIASPSEGPSQVWDYSSLQAPLMSSLQFFDANADTNFVNALNFSSAPLAFQSFPIESNLYEAIDSNGWYQIGRTMEDVTYSLAAISGGSNDSIHFIGGAKPFDGRINTIQFPMTYQDQWNQNHDRVVDYVLNIAAYGMVDAPGSLKENTSENREVVGYGKLTVPQQNGLPSSPMDVLLLKVNRTTVDSFFLGGQPAPAPMLAAFGLTQGSITVENYYVFYKPDFGSAVLSINLNDSNEVKNATYRITPVDTSTSIHDFEIVDSRSFPNPVESGQLFNIQMKTPLKNGSVSFFSLDGRLIDKINLNGRFEHKVQVNIPKNFPQGLYLFQVEDEFDSPIMKGKVFIR